MQIHQSRQYGLITHVDHSVLASGRCVAAFDANNRIAVDPNRYFGDGTAGFTVDQTTRMNECVGIGDACSEEDAAEQREKSFHRFDPVFRVVGVRAPFYHIKLNRGQAVTKRALTPAAIVRRYGTDRRREGAPEPKKIRKEHPMAGSAGSGEQWSSQWGFLLASVGFAVGMGNIWRFPYQLGENGGAAFLIIYLVFSLGIGLPLLITELTIGRRGGASASQSVINVALESGRSGRWGMVGTLGTLCAFVILSYYSVLSGWTLDYFVKAASGTFEGVDGAATSAMFSGLLSSPGMLLFWNTLVHILIILVIRQGVQSGIERAVKILMPALFGAIFIMVIYGVVAGDMASTLRFLLEPDFSKITFGTAMSAIGQAFFSIGIGMGSLYVFGSYMPKDFSIPRSATIVILMDTGVAVLAGFAIFPLVFQYGLDPGAGAGLVFETRVGK